MLALLLRDLHISSSNHFLMQALFCKEKSNFPSKNTATVSFVTTWCIGSIAEE